MNAGVRRCDVLRFGGSALATGVAGTDEYYCIPHESGGMVGTASEK